MEIFKVDRSKLKVPETKQHTGASMLDGRGMSCIMGLYGRFNNVPESDLIGNHTPRQVFRRSSNDITHRVYGKFINDGFCANFIWNLININDTTIGDTVYFNDGSSCTLESHKHREELWTEKFAKLGIQVEFFGELSLAEGNLDASN